MKLGFTDYIPKGRLERFNKKSPFLYNVREVIREAHILKQKGEYSEEKLKKIFPQSKWRYNPFELIRVTALIKPEDYVVIQDILEKHTGNMWEFDKLIRFLLYKFIKEYEDKEIRQDKRTLKKFNEIFKKYYRNIMGSWKG